MLLADTDIVSLGSQTATWDAEERDFLARRLETVQTAASSTSGQPDELGAERDSEELLRKPTRRSVLQDAERHASRQREVWQKQLEAKQAEATVRPRQLAKLEGPTPERAGVRSSPEDREVCARLGLAYADSRLFFVEGGSVQRRCSPPSALSSYGSAATPQSGLRVPRPASTPRPRSASSRTATVSALPDGQASTPKPWR